jgi:chromosome segregation ATPase
MKNSKPDSLKIVKAQQLSFLDLEQSNQTDVDQFEASSDFELGKLSIKSLALDSDDFSPVNEIFRQFEKLLEQIDELKLQLAQCYEQLKELGWPSLESHEGDVISFADWNELTE